VRSSTRRMPCRMCRCGRRRVLHRLRLLFLLLFVFFLLCAVRASRERKTANCNNKYFHKIFHFGVVRPLWVCIYSTFERSLPDAFGPTKTLVLRLSPRLFGDVGARP